MEKYFDRIIEVKVMLKLENFGQVKDKIVEFSISVFGDILFVWEFVKIFEFLVDGVVLMMCW